MATKRVPKRRKRRSRFTTMVVMLVAILVLGISTLILRGACLNAEKEPVSSAETEKEHKPSLFEVKEITVSGTTRYLPEAIIQVGGLYVGESVWSVNKDAAAKAIVAMFPYIETAQVRNTAYNKLDIAVTETKEIGIMYGDGQWLAVGANGKVLNAEPVASDRPLRKLYFKGAELNSAAVGEQAMGERDFAIISELVAAFEQYGLTGVCEIDIGNKSDIRANWNNRLTILFGNDTNLTHEVGVVVSALPGVEERYGSSAAGQFDVSAFSEEGGDRAVFTPKELLTTKTTAVAEPEEADKTDKTDKKDGKTTTTTKHR